MVNDLFFHALQIDPVLLDEKIKFLLVIIRDIDSLDESLLAIVAERYSYSHAFAYQVDEIDL